MVERETIHLDFAHVELLNVEVDAGFVCDRTFRSPHFGRKGGDEEGLCEQVIKEHSKWQEMWETGSVSKNMSQSLDKSPTQWFILPTDLWLLVYSAVCSQCLSTFPPSLSLCLSVSVCLSLSLCLSVCVCLSVCIPLSLPFYIYFVVVAMRLFSPSNSVIDPACITKPALCFLYLICKNADF